uniref:BZIP transcription factor family protein n=1 Tax=Solanum tuberosum TaxID=4113 RepID=M1DV59_SOLTU
MVKDMSSPGLLHSWSSSGVLDEVSVLLHQVSTHVYGYLNVPSPNCGSNLSKGLDNLSNSNRLVHSSPKLGILTIDGLVNGTGYSGKYGGKDHSLHCGQGDQGESNQKNTNKAADTFVHVGNGSDSLAASLYVPSNDKLVNIHGNSIIQSVFASEKAMASHGSADKKNSEAGLAVPGDLAPAVPGIHPCLYRSPAAGQRTLGSEETERQLC